MPIQVNTASKRGAARLRVSVRPVHELSANDVQAWADLESRAVEPNAYLSPYHVLPAARHLDPDAPPLIFVVERHAAGGREMVGVGAFRVSNGTRAMPVPHLLGYRSRHSYLSGLLLDREHVGDSLHALLGFVRTNLRRCSGIHLPQTWADGPEARAAIAGTPYSGTAHMDPVHHPRAVLVPAEASPQMLERALGKRRNDIARRMRRLRERGDVGWRCHRAGGIPEASVEAFLALEHAGWKGDAGSSLRSSPSEEAFFREMVAGFGADNRAVFSELTLDGQVIASISNFISGRVGFGFKIGWNPEFKAYAPGILNEVEFFLRAANTFPDIDLFDSGAAPDSFINQLWPQRRSLSAVTLPTQFTGRIALSSRSAVRSLKRGLESSSGQVLAWHASRHEIVSVGMAGLADLAALF